MTNFQFEFNCDFTEETLKDGDVSSAKPAILEIQQKDVKFADAKDPDPKIMTAIEKLANANARRTMMDINAMSARFVYNFRPLDSFCQKIDPIPTKNTLYCQLFEYVGHFHCYKNIHSYEM